MEEKLKPLPWAPRKGRIYKMYWHYPESKIRKHLHLIIRANRNLREDEKLNDHFVFHNEFVELILTIGMPQGYKPFKEIEENLKKKYS
jgi:hypothetical protein